VVRYLRDKLNDNDVFARDELVRKTMMYWTALTRMGMAFFITAPLALVIVGHAIYASTLEHLRECGTFKAIGARNKDIDHEVKPWPVRHPIAPCTKLRVPCPS
jgi:ABC-type antimicrobial peptide transport system permease subunit